MIRLTKSTSRFTSSHIRQPYAQRLQVVAQQVRAGVAKFDEESLKLPVRHVVSGEVLDEIKVSSRAFGGPVRVDLMSRAVRTAELDYVTTRKAKRRGECRIAREKDVERELLTPPHYTRRGSRSTQAAYVRALGAHCATALPALAVHFLTACVVVDMCTNETVCVTDKTDRARK